jgi:uncharacterized protein YndB with AHSA1/START domain
MGMRGVYREVTPPERLVTTTSWGGDWAETLNTLILQVGMRLCVGVFVRDERTENKLQPRIESRTHGRIHIVLEQSSIAHHQVQNVANRPSEILLTPQPNLKNLQ